jgi:predicted MPP superfamily phosphohydrolase
VLTGDFRFRTFGPYTPALEALSRLRAHLRQPTYAVLGNHDTIRMVPGMEALDIRVLMNESVRIERANDALYLAGIDDAHYFRTHNFQRAAHDIPQEACAVLLSHTPEPYRHAAHAGFSLMLCGHTHGGQICLPVACRSSPTLMRAAYAKVHVSLSHAGRLYVSRLRIVYCRCSAELPARSHATPAAASAEQSWVTRRRRSIAGQYGVLRIPSR